MTSSSARGDVSSTSCPDCAAGLEHCHDVLVVHVARFAECTGDPACDLGRGGHPLSVACSELEPPCGCSGSEGAPR